MEWIWMYEIIGCSGCQTQRYGFFRVPASILQWLGKTGCKGGLDQPEGIGLDQTEDIGLDLPKDIDRLTRLHGLIILGGFFAHSYSKGISLNQITEDVNIR